MFPHHLAACQNHQGGRSATGRYGQGVEQCCHPNAPASWGPPPGNYPYGQPPSVRGRLAEMRQALGGRFQATSSPQSYNMHSTSPTGGQSCQLASPYARAPYNHYDAPFKTHSDGSPCDADDFWNGQNVGGDGSGFGSTPWDGSYNEESFCDPWASTMTGSTPFSNPSWSDQTPLGNGPPRPPPTCPNPQAHQGYSEECSLRPASSSQSLLSRIMNKLRPPPPKCPLKPRTANHTTKSSTGGVNQNNSCFRPIGSSRNQGDAFESLDDLWNPRKIRRWGCVDNWDQHKESQWKQVVENKIGSCGPAGRSVENKVQEALDALHQEGADCIAFRMFYGILKRNEDVYLNPYLSLMTDEEFLRLIVALNNFYFEDKDKAKAFLDHPPPSWIEKIMQKETLAILDPSSRAPSIARRFWELLLDWYVQKLVAKGDPSASCATSRATSQSSLGSLC